MSKLKEGSPEGREGENYEFSTRLVDNVEIQERWDEIETALQSAFTDADFIEKGHTVENPILHTRLGIEGLFDPSLHHVVTFDTSDKIIGGIFCVPTQNKGNPICDLGWVFVSRDIGHDNRMKVLDSMVDLTFDTLKKAGFKTLMTTMGTRKGAAVLGERYRRHGLVHAPLPDQPNRWVANL